MQISEEEKEKRVRLANLLLADVLFLFALSKRNQDHHYLSEAFQKRYLSSVKKVTEPDQKMQRYIRKVCDSIVDTTLKGQKGGLLADSKANQPRDPYAVSMDRATNVAENEANTILNGDEYNAAIKNGCTKKRWTSYKDERVRADHADVDGQVIDINRPFHVGEYMMMYPKDDSLGAGLEEIVNCRCSVEYLTDCAKNFKMNLQLFAEKDLKNQSNVSLKKAIRNFQKRIEEHKQYISHPEIHCNDWEAKDVREQEGLMKHWNKEIKNFQESIDNRIMELRKRGDYDE